ncbi:MAG TPA: hypothetical protein VJR89_17170 [Polyangiales bacterium]|nr:hypothetical protein [Polyangiales bacterium]
MNKRLVTWLSLSAAVVFCSACGGNSPASQPAEAGGQAADAAGTSATSPAAGSGSAAGTSAAAPVAGQAGAGSAGRAPAASAGTGSAAAGTSDAAGTAAGSAAEPSAGAPAAGGGGAGGAAPTEPAKPRRAVSADFLEQTLSIVDVDKLKEGGKRSDALIGKVDLSMFLPGPLAVAVTPDGKTAVVSISGGWLGLVGAMVPAGDGTLVFVDLEKRTVIGDLNTGRNPMGIAITKDGKHAFVGQMSDTYMAYVDIEKRTYERISTGNSWNEELAIDDTGMVGALTTGIAGDAMTFSIASPSMTKGQTRGLTGDAGGVAFFPGTLFAFVVQAPTALTQNTGGYNVIDASNPAAPKMTDNVRVTNDMRIAYPVTSVPNRKSVVYPSTEGGKLNLIEMALENGKAKQVQKLEAGAASTLAYGLSSSAEGLVLAACGTDHNVYVADLATGKAFTVPWETTKTGPIDIKYIP